jgi:hypothetical protein
MLGFITALIKNPLTSLVVDKTVNAINHHLEVKKLERIAEIEAAKVVSVAQVEASEKSLKDEYLTIFITVIIGMAFLPQTQAYVIKGFDILKQAPAEFWWSVLIVFSGSFGINVIDKFKR